MIREIKLAKIRLKDKVEDELWNGNSCCARRGIKAMVGIQDKMGFINDKSALAEVLNQLYLRFESHDFSDELAEFRVVSESSQIQINALDV